MLWPNNELKVANKMVHMISNLLTSIIKLGL